MDSTVDLYPEIKRLLNHPSMRGKWRETAKRCDVSYRTICRIANSEYARRPHRLTLTQVHAYVAPAVARAKVLKGTVAG